jgi:hypothetical protein
VALTVESLAVQPRWESAAVLALPGKSRGDLVGAWGKNVVARFGEAGLARVRARLPAPLDRLELIQSSRDWLPVFAQLLVTEAIVDELLGGDWPALYPLLVEDTRTGLGRLQLALLRAMGPARALRLGPSTFAKVHERGAHEVELAGRRARLTFRDSPLFAHPSWRILQLLATRALLELTGHAGSVVGEDGGAADSFVAIATW